MQSKALKETTLNVFCLTRSQVRSRSAVRGKVRATSYYIIGFQIHLAKSSVTRFTQINWMAVTIIIRNIL